MTAAEVDQGWTQDGTFVDADGVEVRCYDDVRVLEEVDSAPDARGSTVRVPVGTTGTVLFYSTGKPCFLELEYELPGAIFGVIEAHKARLATKNEEKYPR